MEEGSAPVNTEKTIEQAPTEDYELSSSDILGYIAEIGMGAALE